MTKKIQELSTLKESSIEVYINSYGGLTDVCFHIVALVEMAKAKGITVKTIVVGSAYSAGSMLAITGTKGHRYIDKNAEHLIHYGEFDGYRKSTPTQVDRGSARFKRHALNLLNHYKKYSNVPDLEEHIKDDFFWIDAKSCIKWKLADKYMEQL